MANNPVTRGGNDSRRMLGYAVIFVVLAVLVNLQWLRHHSSPQAVGAVVVAKQDVPAHTVLDESMLIRRDVPLAHRQPLAVETTLDAVGRVTRVPLKQGQQLSATELGFLDEAPLSLRIDGGMRALTLVVSPATGVGGHIQPGDRVDLLGTFEYTERGSQRSSLTKPLLADVQVLAIDRRVEGISVEDVRARRKQGDPGSGQQDPSSSTPQTITVSVSPIQAVLLVQAAQTGTVTALLCPTASDNPSGDVARVEVNFQDLLGLERRPVVRDLSEEFLNVN